MKLLNKIVTILIYISALVGCGGGSTDNVNTLSGSSVFNSTVSLVASSSSTPNISSSSTVASIGNSSADNDSAWALSTNESHLSFVTTKNSKGSDIIEVNGFDRISGDISNTGLATLHIDLDSVNTSLPLRDQRVRELLFETTIYPVATVTLPVSPGLISRLEVGQSVITDITASLNLHGVTADIATEVSVKKLSNSRILVSGTSPVVTKADTYGLASGVEALRAIVGLASISGDVPVEFALVFDARSNTGSSIDVSSKASASRVSSSSSGGSTSSMALSGASIYAKQCAGCHGSNGKDSLYPLDATKNVYQYSGSAQSQTLSEYIADWMPLGFPDNCKEQCSLDVAAYIRTWNSSANQSSASSNNGSQTNVKYTLLSLPETLQKFSTTVINRRPTSTEISLAATEAGFNQVVLAMMAEDEFGVWLKTTFNDLLFTNKYLLSASSTTDYTDHGNPSGLEDTSSPYLESNVYFDSRCYTKLINWSFAQEPLELIRYIAINDLDIAQILTANFRMVNYYTQRDKVHGTKLDGSLFSGTDFKYEKYDAGTMKTFFCNPYKYTDDTLASQDKEPASGDNLYFYNMNDFKPALLPKKVNGATGINNSLSLTYQRDVADPLPLAGVLTSEVFLERYPTNSGNRNRLRAAKLLKFFLDIDIGASQVNSIDSDGFANPIMEDPNCTGCHKVLDPIASSFRHWLPTGLYWPDIEKFTYSSNTSERRQQVTRYGGNFWNFDGMLPAGFGGEAVPENKDPLQWVASKVVAQKRNYTGAIIRTLYNGLLGEYDNPEYFRSIYDNFEAKGVTTNHIKDLVLGLIKLDDYRINGVTQSGNNEENIRSVRLLTPEMLARRIYSSTNMNWEYLKGDSAQVLYGGIDSDSYTARLTDLSGVSEAFSERMAAEMACWTVTNDFRKSVTDRQLFPFVSISDQPESDEKIAKIKNNIVYLHDWLLGEKLALDSTDVAETYALFLTTYQHYRDNKNSRLDSECQAINNREYERQRGLYRVRLPASQQITNDSYYTIKSWMAVTNYLLLDAKFLHQ